jgi:hypothetical protein
MDLNIIFKKIWRKMILWKDKIIEYFRRRFFHKEDVFVWMESPLWNDDVWTG